MAREGIILYCTKCKNENYITKINKKTQTEKLEINKYCPNCNNRINHKQKK